MNYATEKLRQAVTNQPTQLVTCRKLRENRKGAECSKKNLLLNAFAEGRMRAGLFYFEF